VAHSRRSFALARAGNAERLRDVAQISICGESGVAGVWRISEVIFASLVLIFFVGDQSGPRFQQALQLLDG